MSMLRDTGEIPLWCVHESWKMILITTFFPLAEFSVDNIVASVCWQLRENIDKLCRFWGSLRRGFSWGAILFMKRCE